MTWSKRPLTPAAIICSCKIQNSVKERFSPRCFDKGKRWARNCRGRRKHQFSSNCHAHPTSANYSRGLDSISWISAAGAAELITSKSSACSLWLLVRVWQKSCRNPCLGGKVAAGSWGLRRQSMPAFNSESPLRKDWPQQLNSRAGNCTLAQLKKLKS